MRDIFKKIENSIRITSHEALQLYQEAPLADLAMAAFQVRCRMHDPNVVTWQIDRNVNITNVCVSACRFCNFHCRKADKERIFVTTKEQYKAKIEELIAFGGDQLLLQGGMHPDFDITFYEELFRSLKESFPAIKLHALGPPEIVHIARLSKLTIRQTLERLVTAGLKSLPGAGAEILDTAIRRTISPGKASAEEWLNVMREAHKMGMLTSATMMYGHIEEPHHRIEHLIKIRELQDEKPTDAPGFMAFIAWPFCSSGTALEKDGIYGNSSATDYLRLIAISRIVLDNIPSIQASWLTVGSQVAQMALHYGANDMGSIMIEENVVSSAGVKNHLDSKRMQQAIRDAGFTPLLRDQSYQLRDEDILLR